MVNRTRVEGGGYIKNPFAPGAISRMITVYEVLKSFVPGLSRNKTYRTHMYGMK